METPLTAVTKVFDKIRRPESIKSLEGLQPKDLPEQELRSFLGLELCHLFTVWFSFDAFELKGVSRFNQNKIDWSLFTPVALAIRIAFTTSTYEQTSLFTERNADYLKASFDRKFSGLGDLINSPSDLPLESSLIFARSIKMIDAAVERAGLRYSKKCDDFLNKSAALYAAIQGSTAAVTNFLSSQDLPEGWTEIFKCHPSTAHLRTTPEATPPTAEPIEQPIKHHPIAGLSNAGSAESQYDQWVNYCKNVAAMQRFPERLMSDLFPPKEVADHSLKDLTAWEDALEQTFPGRRQWLLDEGVTRRDFDTFWGFPSWVQNFIEKLMSRNRQLEYQGHLNNGLSEDSAISATAMFIPMYKVSPDDAPIMFKPLPYELFERVRKHLATIDETAFQDEFNANKFVTCNQYVRMCIKEKRL